MTAPTPNPTPDDRGLASVNLYLVGLMGAGKTTTGQRLAEQLGYRFLDTDELVERISGRQVTNIFAEFGEAQFRTWESQVLAEVSAYPRLVVATGGGIVLNPLNWSYLHHGIIVWLNVPLPQLADRLSQDASRPLLQNEPKLEKLEQLWNQRCHLYAQADLEVKVATDDDTQAVVDRILTAIPGILKSAEE